MIDRLTILYRNDVDWAQEAEAAKQYFYCTDSRMNIKSGDLVLPRFSALPFYQELENDIKYIGAQLINTYKQHRYVANIANWDSDLKEFTPKMWDRLEDLPEEGPFVLKGETNSKKFSWRTHMFAKNKREAISVHSRLTEDSLISQQAIYIRQYIPLKTFMIGIQDLPITNEYRFFCYKSQILSGGFYWSNYTEELKYAGHNINYTQVPFEFVQKIANIVKPHCNFYTIDVAQAESGEWILIELNDGQMSGLSENDPLLMYDGLFRAIDAERNYIKFERLLTEEEIREALEQGRKEAEACFVGGNKILGTQYFR